MDLNFRRLGPVFYRPQCGRCAECRMIRVSVAEFRPSRAQRRCRTRNRDLSVEVTTPMASAEKQELYRRYLGARHDGQMDGSSEEFEGFLCASRVRTVEIDYRAGGRLLAVGIADVEPLAMSAVYCFFDPEAASRSLGVFNVLWMIEECRRRGLPHLYLGYYVRESRKMSYKALYRPHEVLGGDGHWLAVHP
jgi:arginine-tRNA-protein transferase